MYIFLRSVLFSAVEWLHLKIVGRTRDTSRRSGEHDERFLRSRLEKYLKHQKEGRVEEDNMMIVSNSPGRMEYEHCCNDLGSVNMSSKTRWSIRRNRR